MPAPASAARSAATNGSRTISPNGWSGVDGNTITSEPISRCSTLRSSALRYASGGVKYWSSM